MTGTNWRLLHGARMSRRTLMKLTATTVGAASLTSLLAACSGGDDGIGNGEEHIVEMNDQLRFDPDHLTIKVGDTVTWTTVGAIPHTATADPGKAQNPEEHVQLPEEADTWDSGNVAQGEEWSYTFEVPGDYTYFCIPHEAQGMIGTLTVEEA